MNYIFSSTHKYITFTGSLIVLMIPLVLFAQTSIDVAPESDFGALEKPIISDEYVLMPGDSVLVTITGATNYSYPAGITFEGKITINIPVTSVPTTQGVLVPKYDIVDAIPIYGLSLKVAKDSLRKAFMKYYRNIHVDITLLGMRRFVVFVAGEVRRPGVIYARPVDRVSRVIQRAGGVTTLGSRSTIKVMRADDLYNIADLEEFESTGNTTVNPYVQDGDLILVSRMEQSVIVKGAVFGKRGYELRVAQLTAARERTSEGLYELNEGERVTDLISKAGGVTPWADLIHTYIVRDNEKLYIDLKEVMADENHEDNMQMVNNDVLIIPAVNAIVYVQGQVVNPGAFPFQANLHASDYIGLAGGPLDDANMGGSFIQRGEEKISIKKDPIIEEGDRVFVPRQIFKFWQDYVQIGSVFATLLISYLTLTAASSN